MTNWLKRNAGHVIGVALFIAAAICIHSYVAERDARLVADTKVQDAQAAIAELQAKQAEAARAAKVQVIRLQKRAAEVKTPEAALEALPEVSANLDPVPLPDMPGKAAVDVVPLYQTLNACKQTEAKLNACALELDAQKQISAEQQKEIAAEKKKPGFWRRVKSTAKAVGIGTLIGAAAVEAARHGS